ncbi:tetraprenyl-beta-curcumene synthase family protein [Tumebacillus permanentifrigoris]|uniref:Tetraprenyl-beta-curcumene synthase n=1 Tax=Tumebacillus permanentifrigoris TaxID=378543 RepID=A0A316D5T1_9BACL|nr:tetraprenyl-beta-curcumene synthase family protein [Tumebacillus permanentifrigoris]PWK06647.1 tetraprenyl-beta-curcumene synthase [Tumebacillus permanentifrigoris]
MIRHPETPFTLLRRSFRDVLPASARELKAWHERASEIPDPELQRQALMSLTTKRFHADGGTVYATAAASEHVHTLVKLIVALQTISDYLDNLCDRSTSLDPQDFRQIHHAMLDAVTLEGGVHEYYAYRDEKNDGGYLTALVRTCQDQIALLPSYPHVQDAIRWLVSLYCDLQVHKHVRVEDREPRLIAWHEHHAAIHRSDDPRTATAAASHASSSAQDREPLLAESTEVTAPILIPELAALTWYEFSAATGSTLGMFMLFLAASDDELTTPDVHAILRAYFPWIGGLHILLDYFIDQEEDLEGGDLNFVTYYDAPERAYERIEEFASRSLQALEDLPSPRFHRLVLQGLVGMYFSDAKVLGHSPHRKFVLALTADMGRIATLFHWVCRYYRKRYDSF